MGGEDPIANLADTTDKAVKPAGKKVAFQKPAEVAIAVAFMALKEHQPKLEERH